MAQKKTARQVKADARRKEIRHGLAVLKRKGLYSGDAKRAKANSYQASLVREHADVIKSQATALKLDRKTAAEFKAQGARVRKSRVIVEAAPKERVVFDKRRKLVIGKRRVEGSTVVREVYYQHTFDPNKIPKPPKNAEFRYRAGFKQPKRGGTTYTPWWSSVDELKAYMNAYKSAKKSKENTKQERKAFEELWTNSVEIQYIEYLPEDEDFDDDDYESLYS